MTIPELIAALEAAEGPSAKLDGNIHLILFPEYLTFRRGAKEADAENYFFTTAIVSRDWREHIIAAPYTASIDAALTLVPNGLGWLIGTSDDHPSFHCHLFTLAGEMISRGIGYSLRAPTPALAICIAALKARLSSDPPPPADRADDGVA